MQAHVKSPWPFPQQRTWRYRWLLYLWLVIGLLGGPAAVQAQEGDTWQVVGGPRAFVHLLASDPQSPDFLLAFFSSAALHNPDHTPSVQGYVKQSWAPYLSNDGGDSWQPASNDLAEVHPTALAMVETQGVTVAWVGSENKGLWRSDNGGRTWRPVSVPGLQGQRVLAIAQDAKERLHVLAVDNTRYPDSHLYTLAAGSWGHHVVHTYTADPLTTVSDLVADPFHGDRLYITTLGGLLISADGGGTWQQVAPALPPGSFPGGEAVLAADSTQRGRLYLVVRSTQLDGSDLLNVYRSLDSGQSWEQLPAVFKPFPGATPHVTPRPYRLLVDPRVRNQLFLATHNGLWLSQDGGLHWRLAGSALADVTVTQVWAHPHQRGLWLAGGPAGLWRTANAGTQWIPLQEGLPVTASVGKLVSLQNGRVLLALNTGPLPAASAGAGGQPMWRSTDGGQTWMPALRGALGVMPQDLQAPDAVGSLVLAPSSQGLLRSDDAGRSWQLHPLPDRVRQILAISKGQRLLAGGPDGVWLSPDGGVSWQQGELTLAVQRMAQAPDGAILAIADTKQGARQLVRSADFGATWQPIGPAPGGLVQQFLVHPRDPRIMALRVYWGGLYVSVDGGRVWRRRDAGIASGIHWRGLQPEQPLAPNLVTVFIDPQDPTSWWVSRDGGGVYRSRNLGLAWQDASGDLGNNLLLDFTRAGDRLLAVAPRLGLLEYKTFAGATLPPAAVDLRLEILWPHDFAPVQQAQQANLGLRLYRSRSLEPPPCAWTPNVEVWAARDAEPLRRLDLATPRSVLEHPFPFWDLNDIDVQWANDPAHKLVFMARLAPGQALSASSVWIHAADARTWLPEPPQPTGLTSVAPAQIDGLIQVVWPHDAAGAYAPVGEADFVNLRALLVARDTLLALAPEHLPDRVWLVGALDNQVGRRLAVGQPRSVPGAGFSYTVYEFNNIDVSLARDPEHHWTFWLEVPDEDASSNVWVHGSDGRTHAPDLLQPISACQP